MKYLIFPNNRSPFYRLELQIQTLPPISQAPLPHGEVIDVFAMTLNQVKHSTHRSIFIVCSMPSWCPALLAIVSQCVYEVHDIALPTSPLAITSDGLRQIAQCAVRFATSQQLAKRVPFDEWISTFGGLFKLESESACQFELDIVVCMLQECFGLPIPKDEWEHIKNSFAATHAQKRRMTIPLQAKRSLSMSGARPRPEDDSPQLHRQIGMEPRSGSHESLSRSCSRSTMTSTGSKSQRLSCSGSCREEELQHEVELLRAQNVFLQNMLASSQTLNKQHMKTIRDCKLKLARSEIRAEKVKQLMLKQTTRTKDGFNIRRVQDDKHLDKQVRNLRADRFDMFEEAESELDSRKSNSHLTPQGSIALAVRRCLGNCSANCFAM